MGIAPRISWCDLRGRGVCTSFCGCTKEVAKADAVSLTAAEIVSLMSFFRLASGNCEFEVWRELERERERGRLLLDREEECRFREEEWRFREDEWRFRWGRSRLRL